MWKRLCPLCDNEIVYKNKYRRNYADKNRLMCNKCAVGKFYNTSYKRTGNTKKLKKWKRICPKCKCDIFHTSRSNRDLMIKLKKLCKTCGTTKMSNTKKGKSLNHLQDWYKRTKNTGPFIRKCPDCQKELTYCSNWSLKRANSTNTVCNSCSSIKYKKSWTYVIKNEHIQKMAATKAGYDTFDEYISDLDSKKKYRREVMKITKLQNINTLENSDKLRGLCGVTDAYQLDHIISIDEGYRLNLSPEVIGHIDNLQIIPWKDNLLKSNR